MTRTNIPHPEERSAGARLEGRAAAPQEVPPPGRRIEITLGPEDGGVRLDRALQRQLPELSRTRLKQLILSGQIASDGDLLRDPAQRAGSGTGMVVHPAPGNQEGTLVNALLAHCGPSLAGIGGVRRPGIVHRLDKDTSGLLVAAKTERTHRALSHDFALRRIERAYSAVVWGVPAPAAGEIVGNIGRSPSNRKRMAVVAETRGRSAVTRYRVERRFGADASGA